MIHCTHCQCVFDLHSQQKREAGGRRNECPDCTEESEVRYLGVQSAAGKQAGVSVLKFNSTQDRDAFRQDWRQAIGMHKGKSCPLNTAPRLRKISFQTVATGPINENHKGKA